MPDLFCARDEETHAPTYPATIDTDTDTMTTDVEVSPVKDAVPAVEGDVKPDAKAKADKPPARGQGAPVKDVPKPDKPRVAKPDRTELEATIAVLQEAADNHQARIEELKRKIEARRDARKNVNAGTQETRQRIAELNQAFNAHMVRAAARPRQLSTRGPRCRSAGFPPPPFLPVLEERDAVR